VGTTDLRRKRREMRRKAGKVGRAWKSKKSMKLVFKLLTYKKNNLLNKSIYPLKEII
jgi:hypothetical protein